MAGHQRRGGRGGGGRGQANPNVAQAGYRGGRGGQYYDDDRGGQDYGGRGRGRDGRGGRGGGRYQGGRDGGGGQSRGYYQGCRDGGSGRGRRGDQGGRDGGWRGGRGRGGRGGRRQGDECGSSSQPPVLRQAELRLAALSALKKFQAMDIYRGAPMFPVRPGLGTSGDQCLVRANHFCVHLDDKGLHQYDVSITPESTLKGVYRDVMSKLVSEHQHTELGGRLPAYDGAKSLFTAGELPFKSKEFDVTLTAGRAERTYKVAIKHATVVSLEQLKMLMAGVSTDIPAQALQVLDIVFRDILLNERKDMRFVAVGRSFFSPPIGEPRKASGTEVWTGFYQSIRPTQNGLSLIVDISSTAFIEPLPLVDYIKKILSKKFDINSTITIQECAQIKTALKGVKIEVTHRGDQRRKYTITTLTSQLLRDLTFEAAPGVSKTVKDYFREAYSMNLQYDLLPCVQVGSGQRPNYLPMEVCTIVRGQRYQKKLDEEQVTALRNSTCQTPDRREDEICQTVERNQYNSTNLAKEFGIQVKHKPTSVQARVLRAPALRYYGTHKSERLCFPAGSWNMVNKKVVDGARVSNWACINFCPSLHNNAALSFCHKLVRKCKESGLDIDYLTNHRILTADPRAKVEDVLPKLLRDMLPGQNIDLLLAILPDKHLYGNFKKVCDTDIGIMSQCCLEKNVKARNNYAIIANIALKINAKLGGRNTVLVDPHVSLPVVSKKTTIIFGADVTHPAAQDDSSPSIASVVATSDWPEVAKYNGVARAQGHRVEIINGLEDTVKELLQVFQKCQGEKPQQLIFYRDGVSEGQFKIVLEQEIPAVEKAWKDLYNDEKPQITFIVVQKRHHTRLFTGDPGVDSTKNVLPGTVVDSDICHPTEFDFFLCSHAGIKGTSRPTHYHVLRDDNKFTADDLQTLTYNLCFTYSSCTRSVSIAPPAYYAHKLAFRARFYLPPASDAETSAAAATRELPQVKEKLKMKMYYC